MEDKEYQRQEGKNDAEKAYLPKGKLESLFVSEETNPSNYGEEKRVNKLSGTEEIKSLDALGKKYIENKDYFKAYEAYSKAAIKARDLGLSRMHLDYLVLAGNAVYKEGGWLNYQKAADCYATVGEKGLLEKMFKELHYSEEDITPGSWMGMARDLVNINKGRYGSWR